MSERPEDVLTNAIEHYDHGLFTRKEALEALAELASMREALERIARPTYSLGEPTTLKQARTIARQTLASLSPPSTNEEGDSG